MSKLGIFEIKEFSVDKLLIDKPETLPYLESIENEPNNFSMSINGVNVFGVRSHKIVYGANYAIIKFYDKNEKLLATLSAFGSCDGDKEDESFYVGFGFVISGTSLRVMNHDIKNYKM